MSRKNPKSLSGIETLTANHEYWFMYTAGKTLNPYQGLKRSCCNGD